ncbi:TetR/AcrR family transcriptional regulator [Vallicoccus soli]|uniref:TetR/AcrR family transcriptional regulator n=1 Tax=Vallicoccus soli TaxID=2339232 RepID=UPI001403D40B|nr:TetR/AcrR family transcriptional regulator [Vallicoccus soli]
MPTRRERARAATVDEIKQTALRLVRERGTTDVPFADVARAMGMTAPALYRYFADRDALLTALLTDAYGDLADALAGAAAQVPEDDLGSRLLVVGRAYRDWARREPQRFALMFGLPVPGYHAPEEGPLTEAAKRAVRNLHGLMTSAAAAGRLGPPLLTGVAEPVAQEMCATQEGWYDDPLPADSYQAMLHLWSLLQGAVTLDAYGHFDWLSEATRDALFDAQVRLGARLAGLPEPPEGA